MKISEIVACSLSFFCGMAALAQTAEIRVLPPTPAATTVQGQTPGTVTTTVVTTTTTTTAQPVDERSASTTTAAPSTSNSQTVPGSTSSSFLPSPSVPSVVPTANSAPTAFQFPNAETWVDDGSMDTRSQVERARRAIKNSMAADPWLAASVNKISVSADGESLTLSGMVSHSQERDAIERIARESAGQLRLINSIRVR